LPVKTFSRYETIKSVDIKQTPNVNSSYLDFNSYEIEFFDNTTKEGETINKLIAISGDNVDHHMNANVVSILPKTTEIEYVTTMESTTNVRPETLSDHMTYKGANVSVTPTQTGTHEVPYTGSLTWLTDRYYRSFVNLLDLYGTSSNDTHFVNAAWDASSSLGGVGDSIQDSFKNVNYHEGNYTFEMVGDLEIQSGSFKFDPHLKPGLVDHTDIRIFGNRKIADKGKGYIYKSYVKFGGNIEGPQDGRPVGKTSYYVTKSKTDGNFHYPSNHWINFSEDPFRAQMFKGTECRDLTFQSTIYEDYTSSCAYTIQVEKVDELKAIRGVGSIIDGRVSYS